MLVDPSIIILVCIGVGFLVFCIRACLMSKCRKISFSLKNGLQVERDTSHEQNVSQLKLEIPGIGTSSK
jgi:hypothetical protein